MPPSNAKQIALLNIPGIIALVVEMRQAQKVIDQARLESAAISTAAFSKWREKKDNLERAVDAAIQDYINATAEAAQTEMPL